jgi:Na+/H+ antiporter NhaD/arsenite permease-like protein
MDPNILEIASLSIAGLALAGIAVGRLPLLRTNRAGMALVAAIALVALGSLSQDEAFKAIDMDTIALLLSMMVLSAFLRFSGLFDLAADRILSAAQGPKSLLALIIAICGVFSAFFLNDTMCLVMSPLVAALCLQAKVNPLPYLIAVATSSNVGSMCTLIGNPQNMLIGASSGIPFSRFFLRLAPTAALGLAIVFGVIVLVFPSDFRPGLPISRPVGRVSIKKGILAKTLIAAALLVSLLFLGVRPSFAALASSAILLLTRRVKPERIFGEIDVSLLVFFSGLFVITRSIRDTSLFRSGVEAVLPLLMDRALPFSLASALLSNLVSNVPAVMLLSPLAERFADPEKAWLLLAMSSTLAGNLTLLGSVANLIVAESAASRGVKLGFAAYLKAGLPITVLTLGVGTLMLAVV